MRKFVGFFLMLTGVAFGFFAFYPDSPDRESRLAEITEILAAPAGEVSRLAGDTTLMRSFAPAHPVIIRAPSVAAPSRSTDARVVVGSNAPAPKPTPVVAGPPLPHAVVPGWQTVVTTTDTRAAHGRVTSSTPGDGASRYELVLDIQRELKRAGCYGGTLSGSWTPNTKRAMSAFMERVNATLPMEQPDYILLTLIKGQAGTSCSTCPLGQSLSEGRCVPNAIIAKRPHRTDDRDAVAATKSRFTTTTALAEADTTATATISAMPASPLPGRMSMGGPKPDLGVRTGADVATETWKTRVLPAAGARIPPLATAPVAGPTGQRAPNRGNADSRIAALEPEAEAPAAHVALPGTKSGPSFDGADRVFPTDAAVPLPVAAGPPGLPGTKSGTSLYGPSDPQSAFAAPAPRPRAARSRSRGSASRPSRPSYAQRHYTRSVQSFFMHPLGRM